MKKILSLLLAIIMVTGVTVNAFAASSCSTHKSGDWIIDKKATVYSAGSKHKECTKCGKTIKKATIKQLKCSKTTLKTIANTSYGVKITWSKVKGADSYKVYRKLKGGEYSYIGKTTNTYYTDKTANSGKTYYYIVKVCNEAGNSASSGSLSIKYLAKPEIKTADTKTTCIYLKWTRIPGASGYRIYRKSGSGDFERIATVKGGATVTYKDKTANLNKVYTYKIKAYNDKYSSVYSATKKNTISVKAAEDFTKSEIVALYRDGINKAKKNAEKVTYVSSETINYKNIVEAGTMSSTAQSLISSFMGYSEINEVVDNNALPPADISCKLSTSDVKSATITDSGSYYIVKIKMRDETNPVAGEGIGAVVNVIDEKTITESVSGTSAKVSDVNCAYENVVVEAKIEKSTGRIVSLTTDAPMIMTMTVKMSIVEMKDARVGVQAIDKYKIAY